MRVSANIEDSKIVTFPEKSFLLYVTNTTLFLHSRYTRVVSGNFWSMALVYKRKGQFRKWKGYGR